MGIRSTRRLARLGGAALVGVLAACGGPSGPDQAECIAAGTAFLAVGGSAEYSGAEACRVSVEATSTDQEFVLVAFAGADDPISLRAVAQNVVGAFGPPDPSIASVTIGGGFRPGSTPEGVRLPDTRLHASLRDAERRFLSPLLQSGAPALLPSPFTSLGANPSVGDTVTINARSTADTFAEICQSPLNVGARVRAVSDHAIVIADTLNPVGGFGTSDYELYAETFDDLLRPIALENFGPSSDIDGNGRTILFFTREVNRRTPVGSGSFVAGFFFSRDLFPKTASGGLSACPTSNAAEILYLMVPDPDEDTAITGNDFSLDFVRRYTVATMLHEQQHLVNASHRLHDLGLRGDDWKEETWLDEGLSHVAEELLFYEEAGLEPGGNLDFLTLTDDGTPTVNSAFNRHQIFNVDRLRRHLEDPSAGSPFHSVDGLATRGATWSFLRYAADRRGGAEADFFQDLVKSSANGLENLFQVMGGQEAAFTWMSDWAVALYADDRVVGVPTRHTDPSWNQASIQDALTGFDGYPIETHELTAGVPLDQTLVAGGAIYMRFRVNVGTVGQVDITSSGNVPPDGLRLTLLRTN